MKCIKEEHNNRSAEVKNCIPDITTFLQVQELTREQLEIVYTSHKRFLGHKNNLLKGGYSAVLEKGGSNVVLQNEIGDESTFVNDEKPAKIKKQDVLNNSFKDLEELSLKYLKPSQILLEKKRYLFLVY